MGIDDEERHNGDPERPRSLGKAGLRHLPAAQGIPKNFWPYPASGAMSRPKTSFATAAEGGSHLEGWQLEKSPAIPAGWGAVSSKISAPSSSLRGDGVRGPAQAPGAPPAAEIPGI